MMWESNRMSFKSVEAFYVEAARILHNRTMSRAGYIDMSLALGILRATLIQ
jgi:hypothetical protein